MRGPNPHSETVSIEAETWYEFAVLWLRSSLERRVGCEFAAGGITILRDPGSLGQPLSVRWHVRAGTDFRRPRVRS